MAGLQQKAGRAHAANQGGCMRILRIVAAIGLGWATQTVYALPPTATYDISLTVAGSSAQREVFRENFFTACEPATRNIYQARNASSGQFFEFYAYSCRIRSPIVGEDLPPPPELVGRNAIVYYRSEGGAVYGFGALAKNLLVKRLVVDSLCAAAAYPAPGPCPIGPYTLATDSATGNLTFGAIELGTADVERRFFDLTENWPVVGTSVLGAMPTAAQRATITHIPTTGTVFGVLVNASLPVSDLSRQDVYSIFSGVYGDWSQVADTANNVDATGTITVCRRTPGSSAQIAAAIYFNRQACVAASPFITSPFGPIFDNPVIDTQSGTAMGNCVASDVGAIGFRHYTTAAPAGTKWVTINGTQPSKLAAALGDYDFWFESVYLWKETATLPALASYLRDTAQASDYLPNVDSAMALSLFGFNSPEIPVNLNQPVTLGTRNGDSCLPLQGTIGEP